MINAIIVDDEEKAVVVLRRLLHTHCPEINIVAETDEVDTAIQVIREHHPQLIFLDIELAGETGFDLLEKIEVRDFHVVFVTAHSEFALKAFRFTVADYLLKPVGVDLLKEAVQKVSNLIGNSSSTVLEHENQATGSMETLRIPSITGLTFVQVRDIVRLEADGAYTHIHMANGKHYMSSYRLKQFEEHLDQKLFLRAHRSHIINMRKIKSVITKDGLFAEMIDGMQIEVPRRNKEDFLKRISLHH
jgi:two-component system LytT family response regulator